MSDDEIMARLQRVQSLVSAMVSGDLPLTRQLAAGLVSEPEAAADVVGLAWYSAMLLKFLADAEGGSPEIVLQRVGAAIARRADTGFD